MRVPGFKDRHDTDRNDGVDPLTGASRVSTVGAAPGATVVHDGRPAIHDTTTLQGGVHRDRDHVRHERELERSAVDLEKERNDAYQRGLRDGVRAKRNNPVLTILVLLLALLGIAVGVLAIVNGSFREAGGVLDRSAGIAAVEARDAGGELAQDAGSALQREGAEAERAAEAARR
jgi:hypothetical protein